MSGGKGGSSTSSVEIPAYIQAAAQRNLQRADDVSRIGYVPQYNPQVAALTPMEEAAAQNLAGAASSFGMAAPTGADIYGGMDAPTEYAGGVRGYSSAPLYEQSIKELKKARPAQYKYMQSFFIDPVTGKRGSRAADPFDYSAYQASIDRAQRQAYGGGGGDALGPNPVASQRRQQDYNQFRSDYEVNAANAARDPYGQTYAPSSSRLDKNDRSSFMPPSSDGDGGGGGNCVVATHAVNSGAFTPSMKREAVVWCMHNLHNKWWGEAIRRGYRHLGKQKIAEGKAHEHYQEFRDYINFATGKKRTIKGAIHFAARTVQFFAVGLIKGDA